MEAPNFDKTDGAFMASVNRRVTDQLDSLTIEQPAVRGRVSHHADAKSGGYCRAAVENRGRSVRRSQEPSMDQLAKPVLLA